MSLLSLTKEHWAIPHSQLSDNCETLSLNEFYQKTLLRLERLKTLPPSQVLWLDPKLSSLNQLSFIIASLEAGHLVVPTSPLSPDLEQQDLQKILQPEWLIGTDALLHRTSYREQKRPVREGCVLFLTSGSTGNPKWIVQYKTQLLANARQAALGQNLSSESRVFAPLTLAHTGGLNMQTLAALLVGSSLKFSTGFCSRTFSALVSGAFTHTIMVPHHLRLFVKHLKKSFQTQLAKPLLVLTGSSPVNRELLQECLNIENLNLHLVYGLTEAGPYLCTLDSQRDSECMKALSKSGEAFPLGRFHRPHKAHISPQGEIIIKSPAINDYLTQENQKWELKPCGQNVFATNDLGYQQGDIFFFLGRKNRRINLSGYKINPEEIEETLMRHPKVERAHVYALPDSVFYQIPAVKLTLSEKCSVFELKAFLRKRLNPLKVPRQWTFAEHIEVTSIHKNRAS